MKTYKNRIIGLLILLVIISCALESKFGLPNDEKIKPELIGEWYHKKNSDERIIIQKNGEKTYRLLIIEKEKVEELISYSKTIKGYNIMNVKIEFEDTITNVFYGFNLKDSTLTFSRVNDKLKDGEFKSESELLEFFEENIHKEGFFIKQVELKRM